LIQGAAVVALAFISGGSTDRFVGGSVVSATDGGEARILTTSCTNVSDCEGYKGCTSDDNKCKCKNNKCRKKLTDCRIIGPRMSNWSCPPTKECVAQRKWGKCRSIGEAEIFHDSYEFAKNESPESIVFDSKGNAYVSLSLNAFISVLNPEGEEFYRIDMPQGDCRPEAPSDISFPLDTLQFGMAMSKDDTLFVSLLACAEGFPQPPNPNPNTGLWMVNTEDYSIKHIALVQVRMVEEGRKNAVNGMKHTTVKVDILDLGLKKWDTCQMDPVILKPVRFMKPGMEVHCSELRRHSEAMLSSGTVLK